MAAKNSMFEPEDTDILQDMYGTDAGRLTEQQEDMFGTGHESATGACSETFGAEADSPKLAKLRWKRGFGQGARAQSRARAPRPDGAGDAARKSRGATALLLAGAAVMVLLWAAAIFMEGGSNPIAGLFSGRHVENLQPMREAGEYARMDSYFYANDLDVYGQEDEPLAPYAQCVQLYLIRQEFFCDWYDAVHKGDIDAWNMAYKAQEMLAMQREEGILPGNEAQYALSCGEISAFLQVRAGVSGELLQALASEEYSEADSARDEVEMRLSTAMADAFLNEGPGAADGTPDMEGGEDA